MDHASFSRSRALRASLKRGLARQAIAAADRCAPDLPTVFALAAGMRPNRKGLERLAARIKARPGVVRVALTSDGKGLTLLARAVRDVEARVEGQAVFRETGLIYLHARVGLGAAGPVFRLCATSFCQHALERLVERSALPLDAALLPQVDAEARGIFRGWNGAGRIEDAGDAFHTAATPGVWAGGYDRMAMDDSWGLVSVSAADVPIFSARTFLSETEMRPTVWLRWKNDPAVRLI